MAINLNVSPYYDDFDANKKYNRVVFKPGVAVQARELTQMQDYFYETIKDFADYMFVDGACVRGCEAEPQLIEYIKINDTNVDGETISNDTLANYVGDTVVGATTGIKAKIIDVKTGVVTEPVAKKILYLKYTHGNPTEAGDGLNVRFDAGETLTVVSDNTDRNGDKFQVNTDTSLVYGNRNFYGLAFDFVIPDGVLYVQGRFVKHERQKIRLDDYTARVSYFIGVVLKEEIITSDDDATLLDPATGAFNYNAPGADRTKISTVLTKVPFGSEFQNNKFYDLGEHVAYEGNIYEVTTAGTSAVTGGEPTHTSGEVTTGSLGLTYYAFPDNFTSVYKITNGRLNKKLNEELAELAQLGKTLAIRTKEESGDYVISPFTMSIIEHLQTVKGTDFDIVQNVAYSKRQFVNHNGNLYEVTKGGTSLYTSPPTHLSGEAISGTVTFAYRGDSYRFENGGWKLPTDLTDPGDPNYIVAKVSPGIAYVDGYRREFIDNTYLKIRKGLDTKLVEGLDVNMGYGNYFDCEYVVGSWNMEEGALVEIGYYGSLGSQTGARASVGGSSVYGAAGSASLSSTGAPGTVIGTCRIRQIKLVNGDPATAGARYRIFVYDIRIKTGKLTDARTLYYNSGGNDGIADLYLYDLDNDGTGDTPLLQGTEANKMLFPTPWRATKTLYAAGNGTLDTQYYYTEEFEVSTLANGEFSISTTSLGSEVTLPYSGSTTTQQQLDQSFYCVNNGASVTINGVSVGNGEIIRLTPAMVTGQSTTQTMEFDLGTVSAAVDLYLMVTVKVTDAPPVTKNLRTNRYVKIRTTDAMNGKDGPWSLGIPDIKEIKHVFIQDASENTFLDISDDALDQKDEFKLDNGQRDNFYGHGQLVKKGSSSLDLTQKHITVIFDHFEPDYSSSAGTYFAVDSYPVDDTGATGIYTFEIPYYRSQKFGTYDLRDCIDFRPYVKSSAASSETLDGATRNPYRTDYLDLPTNGIQYPVPSTAFGTDVEYYLPRTDRIFINKNGNMRVVEGQSEIPSKPPVLKEGMQIAEVRVTPYPSIARNVAKKFNVIEKAVGHFLKGQIKRYTMKDIGSIEKRISRLEYYLALSLMEMAANDKVILDANGNDRFKNGIYTNPFDSDMLSDLADPSYNAAYNSAAKNAEPNFDESCINMIHNKNHDSSGWSYMGASITRPYSRVGLLENKYPTKTRNCVGELLFNYVGKMQLFPRSDNYPSVNTALEPMNLTASNQAAVQAAAASVNASQNVVGSTTTFQMGGITEGGGFIAGGSNSSTTKVEFSQTGEGAFSSTTTSPIPGGIPESQQVPNLRTGWWEQVQEGSATSTTTGDITTSMSYDQTVTTQSIQQSTTEYLLTASAASAGTLEFNIGGVVRDVTLLPFMRAKNIGVRLSAMKPNTKLYVYFDNEEVTDLCFPARTRTIWNTTVAADGVPFDGAWKEGATFAENSYGGAAIGFDDIIPTFARASTASDGSIFIGCCFPFPIQSDIFTDSEGNASFVFALPGGRFPVGTRRIWVVDDPQNRDSFITTMAENQYSAFGLHTTTQEVSLTAELYQLEYGTTVGGTSTSVVGSVVTGVENSNAEINVEITNLETTIDVTQPEFVWHPPIRFGDPIAQSFTVEQAPKPVFLSRIKVWFRSRPGLRDNIAVPATEPTTTGTGHTVEMRIHKCMNGYPTNQIVGSCVLPYEAVKTTPDISGGQATNFDFRDEYSTNFDFGQGPTLDRSNFFSPTGLSQEALNNPVVLDPTEEYAFVIEPANNDPNYEVWVSVLGETRIGTEAQRVTAEDTYSGVLFTSSNNRTWTPHQAEDMKFALYVNDFEEGTGVAEFVNEHAEYIEGEDFLGGKPDPESTNDWYSFRANIATGGTGYVVDDVIVLDTANVANTPKGIKFRVTAVDGVGAVTAVKPIQYHDGSQDSYDAWPWNLGARPDQGAVAARIFGQSSTTGGGANFTIGLKPKHMVLGRVDNEKNRYDMLLPAFSQSVNLDEILVSGDTTLLPQAGDLWFERSLGRKSFYCKAAGLKKIFNISRTNMTVKEFDGADIVISRAVTKSTGVSARGTTFDFLTPTMFANTLEECAVYSLSSEIGFTGTDIWSKKSYRHRCAISTTDGSVSPILNPQRLSADIREYIINNDSTDETLPLGGNARSRFISKIVRLADGQEAEDMRLSVAQYTPLGSSVKVYFKGLAADDDTDIRRDLNWVEMEYADSNPNGSKDTLGAYIDLDYKLPDSVLNADGVYFYETDRIQTVTIGTQGSGYPSLEDAPIFVASGGAQLQATSLTGSTGINTIQIVDPGSGYDGVAPAVTIGYDHEYSTTFAINQVVADSSATNSANEYIYKAIQGGITNAASSSTRPGLLLDPDNGAVVGDEATDGGVIWRYIGTRAKATVTIDTVQRTGFKYFQCKIVFLSSNTSSIPKIKQLRMIALQA